MNHVQHGFGPDKPVNEIVGKKTLQDALELSRRLRDNQDVETFLLLVSTKGATAGGTRGSAENVGKAIIYLLEEMKDEDINDIVCRIVGRFHEIV